MGLFSKSKEKKNNDCNIVKMFCDVIKSKLKFTIYVTQNDTDLFICDIKQEAKNGFRKGFNIDIDEELLWARDTSFWNTKNQGMVITDRGFHFIPDNDNHYYDFFISWNDIEKVEYKDLNFIIYTHDGGWQQFPYDCFLKKRYESSDFKRALDRLADLFTKIATAVGHKEEKSFWDIIIS